MQQINADPSDTSCATSLIETYGEVFPNLLIEAVVDLERPNRLLLISWDRRARSAWSCASWDAVAVARCCSGISMSRPWPHSLLNWRRRSFSTSAGSVQASRAFFRARATGTSASRVENARSNSLAQRPSRLMPGQRPVRQSRCAFRHLRGRC